MSVSSFYPLLFQYPILSTLAQNLSALDLFHLSLASKTAHSLIQPSKSVFTALTRESLCDGHGLIARQELKGPYDFVTPGRYVWGNSRKIHHDEPIEVNLWAQKCDEANALPCIKCGVNICEECRYLDRVALKAGKLYRKPFPHPNWEHDNFIGLCPKCDLETQRRISGKHLYEDCVCDVWDRWICFKCYCKEEEAIGRYFREHTKLAHDFYYDSDENVYDYERPPIEKTKVIPVHQAALEVRLDSQCNHHHTTNPYHSVGLVFVRRPGSSRNTPTVRMV